MGSEFRQMPLSELAEPILGGTPSRLVPKYWNGGVKWATAKDIAANPGRYLFDTNETISEMGLQKSRAKLLPPETIVITARGTVGAIVQLGEEMACNQTCYGLLPKQDIYQGYLYYALKNSINEIKSLSYGTVFDTITMKTFDSLFIPTPDLSNQKAIAAILGALDDKIELNRKMNQTLEEMARAIFKCWFIDFDPVRYKATGQEPPGLAPHIADLFPDKLRKTDGSELPDGWHSTNLSDIVHVNPPRKVPKGALATYLDMANMPTQGPSPLSWTKRHFSSGMKFINGDTLVARITPCLENGKTAFIDFLDKDETGWGSTEYIVLRPHDPIPPVFAYLLARNNSFRSYAIQQMSGSSGRQRVTAKSISMFKVSVPNKENKIFDVFGKVVNSLFDKISNNMQQIRTLTEIRDTLLPKLISGELRVPDAERIASRYL